MQTEAFRRPIERMVYFVVAGVFAIWVFSDAYARKSGPLIWSVGTFLLGPLVLPFYFAERNLKRGETREGGKGWNVLKNFALSWSFTTATTGIVLIVAAGDVASREATEAGQAGATIGAVMGLGVLGAAWFFPMVGALVLGLFLRKTNEVEKGPTGALA